MKAVFMYGAGDGGPGGWPVQAAASPESVFLDRPAPTDADPVPFDDPERDAQRIVEALGRCGHLVAHSGGAVPALLAAVQAPGVVRSLTLFEPACLGVARGRPGVEAMVADMAAVFERAADPDVSDGEFTHEFLRAMGVPGTDPDDPEYAPVGARLRLSTPPWETPLDLDVVSRVPTLVVTGGWSAAFDEVAEALVAAGASRVVVPGTGHGPQFHPDGQTALAEFHARHD
jgi:pimeloyl-ACP methyl ester carboxylesterase